MALSTVADSNLINNYISSQTAATTAATTTSEAKNTLVGSYDTFLKILTAQLKNQDPTSPMDASEFTQQLVQYSAVEQQIATNDKLDDMLTALNSNGITPLLSYVGQYTESTADGKLVVQGGTAKLAYNLPSLAQSAEISVQDSKGNVVAKISGTTTAGMNRVAWDGTLDSGAAAADGVYKFTITAKNASGEAIKVDDVRVIGLVTGIETGSDGAVTLKVGDLSVKDTDVKSIFAAIATSNPTTT
ncbi:MAG TPA: hypothetical protein DCY07_00565 [Rhodospirillaceae bacterium]|nr:hypothetical protein [Rhodospirillaceae bacterium]